MLVARGQVGHLGQGIEHGSEFLFIHFRLGEAKFKRTISRNTV
jgi:hypothetical protein